jgi:putative hydrolase of the HAD superfamily
MSRKQALILDFGGVVSRTLFESHDETERVLGLARGTLKWRGPFDPANDPLWCDMQAGKLRENAYWKQRAAEVGALVGETWTSPADYMRRVRGVDPNYAIRPESDVAIRRLHAKGVRMTLLTNGLDEFYGADVRSRIAILALVEHMVDATYTRVWKPDPRAYAMALEVLGATADQAVFLDDQAGNVAGARAAGIDSVHFDVTRPADSWAEAERYFA